MKGFFESGSPVIELPVDGRKIKMLLDTGFNGHVMLPQNLIEEIIEQNKNIVEVIKSK